jgi:hypothetical protein
VNQVTDTVIFLLIIALAVIAAICGRKPKSQSAHRSQKRTGRLYHDYDQFQLAMQTWDRKRLQFEQNETARLARLSQKVKKGGAFSACCLFGVVIVALVVGFSDGAATWRGILAIRHVADRDNHDDRKEVLSMATRGASCAQRVW